MIKKIAMRLSDNKGMSGTTFGEMCGYLLYGFYWGHGRGKNDDGLLTCDYDSATSKFLGNIGDYGTIKEARLRHAETVVTHIIRFPTSGICPFRDKPEI